MTDISVLDAAVNLLAPALQAVTPPFTTVGLLGNYLQWDPSFFPMCLVDAEDAVESRIGVGMPGHLADNQAGLKENRWYLCTYLWAYEAGPTFDVRTFLSYVEAVKNTFRPRTRLAGTADTQGTFVLTAAEGDADLKVRRRDLGDRTQGITRYAEVRVLIREGVWA